MQAEAARAKGGSVWAELWLGNATVWLPAARSCGNVGERLSRSVSRRSEVWRGEVEP